MATNAHRGRRLLIKVGEQFELSVVVPLVERGFLHGFLLGFLLGFASEGFEPVDNFLTGDTFEGSIDGITVFNGSSADGDTNLGGFRRLIGDCGNLGVRAAATAEVVFGECGFAVDGVYFDITGFDVVAVFTQVEDASGEAGDVEFVERIKGSDFAVLLDELEYAGLLVVGCFFGNHGLPLVFRFDLFKSFFDCFDYLEVADREVESIFVTDFEGAVEIDFDRGDPIFVKIFGSPAVDDPALLVGVEVIVSDFFVERVRIVLGLEEPFVHQVDTVLDEPILRNNRYILIDDGFDFEQGVEMLVYELPINPFDNEGFNEFITSDDRSKYNIVENLGYNIVEIFVCCIFLGFNKIFESQFKADCKVNGYIHGCFSVVLCF